MDSIRDYFDNIPSLYVCAFLIRHNIADKIKFGQSNWELLEDLGEELKHRLQWCL